MKLTILGKYGPYAKKGMTATSSYLIEDKDTTLLLDMGSGSLCRLLDRIEIDKLDAIFISHLHFDHTSDLLGFRYLLDELKYPVTIYTHYEDSEWYKILFDHPLFNVVNIDENSDILLKSLKLKFYEMEHTGGNYAIRIEGTGKLVYTGDTMYNENILNAIDGVDYMLADCSKKSGFTGPHMTIDDAIKINKETGIKILATHLSPDYSPEKDFEEYPDITVVKELTSYNI
jgi:ribonuclease BN (tRNA processing enzyme)